MNMAATNQSIKVEWYFVAKRADSGQNVLFGCGSTNLQLKASATTAFKATSATLYLHDPHCVECALNLKTDAAMSGYIVRATSEEGNVKFVATQPSFKAMLASDSAFEAVKKASAEWEAGRVMTQRSK